MTSPQASTQATPHPLWAACAFFCVLASNYIVQCLRENVMSQGSGPMLVGISAAVSLVVGAVMTGSFMDEVNESSKVFGFLGLWSVILSVFAVNYPSFESVSDLFFVGSSVATVLCASFLWGLMNSSDLKYQNKFHEFSLASNLGQGAGSVISWIIVQNRFVDPNILSLLTASILCGAGAMCVRQIGLIGVKGDVSDSQDMKRASQWMFEQPSFILAICGFQMLNCLSASLVYLDKLDAMQTLTKEDAASMGPLLNIITAGAIILLQITGVTKLVSARVGLLLLPTVSSVGILLTKGHESSNSFYLISALVITTRVLNYAMSKPSREALFGFLSDKDRMKAKPFVDSVACKLGSVAASPIHVLGKDSMTTLVATLVAWNLITFVVGRRYESQAKLKRV